MNAVSSSTELFAQGVQIATMAVGYDTAGNYDEARPLYFKAAEILHRISAVEVNPVRKQAFRDKATNYVSRVEQLNAVLGVEIPVAKGGSPAKDAASRWQRQENYGDRSYKEARTMHGERQVRQAVGEYKKAMGHYVEASRDADVASQYRIRDKWQLCADAGQQITSVLGQHFVTGPNTVIDTTPRPASNEVELPPGVPTSMPTSSGGGGGGGGTPAAIDDDDDSFDALQARLANLKK